MRVSWIAVWVVLAASAPGCSPSREAGSSPSSAERVGAEVARRAGAEGLAPSADGAAPEVAHAVSALLAQPLTEATAVKLALLNNGRVRESYERLGIARADLLQAGLLRNPVFTLDAKFFSAGPEIELGLAQSFVDLFFLPLRRRVAHAELLAEEAAVARNLVALVYDVRRAFVTVHAAQAIVAIQEQALRRASASRELMQRLHAAGNALDTVRTVEETGAARAQLDLDAAVARALDAREPLNVLLGLDGAAVGWTLAGAQAEPPAGPDPDDAPSRATGVSLDLLESRARIDAALCEAGLVRRQGLWPELDLGAVGKQEASDGAWGFGPQLSTTLPVFDHGQARVLAAHATLRGRVAHHRQLTVEVSSAARRLAARLTALRERERYLREVYLPLRERLVREGLQFFNAMQIGAFDVLHAKQQELDARREYAETIRDTWLALLDLRELLAGSLNPARLGPLELPEAAEHPAAPKGH